MMTRVLSFEPQLAASLPDTHGLMLSANLTVHPKISRGLKGGYRSDSDVDLSLIVDELQGPDGKRALQEVLETTVYHWQASVEPDLALIFDTRNCGLRCFEQIKWNQQICRSRGTDCFGLYKTQKGFHGLVTHAGIRVELMYPCLKIWERR